MIAVSTDHVIVAIDALINWVMFQGEHEGTKWPRSDSALE